MKQDSPQAAAGMPGLRLIQSTWQHRSLLVYCLLVCGALVLLFRDWAYDDPFITFRYSQNLSHGQGFVYNNAERILSTTSPLFTLFLGGCDYVWTTIISLVAGKSSGITPSLNLPAFANLTGIFSLVLGAVFLWDLGKTWGQPLVGWAGIILYPTFPLVTNTLSSEMPLYLALCLGAFAYYARQRLITAAWYAGLAFLTRPDGILVPLLLALDYTIRFRRMIPWKAVAVFLILTLSWMGFAWVYFGSPLPVTLFAKRQQAAMNGSIAFALGFLSILQWFKSWPYGLAAAMAFLGVIHTARRASRWSVLLAWPIVYFTAYSVLGISRYFWYYAPLVPGFIVALGLGLSALQNYRISHVSLPRESGSKPQTSDLHTKRMSPYWVAAAFLSLWLITQSISLWNLYQHPDARPQLYRVVGEWLNANIPANASIGTLETGIIGYYAHRTMQDFAGLLNPDVAAMLGVGKTYEDAAFYVMDTYQPEYLVLQDRLFPGLEEEFVQLNCQARVIFATVKYPYPLVVYQCEK